ncbi:MAG TPA: NUDIX hydrolase [Gaiellaceae bacterium]|nr:NUDIX hydrolase [Gaiellaceae bacterium]
MPPPRPWRVLSSRPALDDPWFRVRRDTVELPDGTIVDDYSVAERKDFALVAAVTESDELVLVRQWKHAIGGLMLELPGGVVDEGDPRAAATRELLEETGFDCPELRRVGGGPLDPSKETNRVHLFAGTGARRVAEQELDVTEEIEVVLAPVRELRDRIRAGEITAPTSVAGIYLALDALGRL